MTGFYGPGPNADGRQQTIHVYDEPNNLAILTDAEDHQTAFAYAGHQVVRETNAVGEMIHTVFTGTNQIFLIKPQNPVRVGLQCNSIFPENS